jgi:hypothetical protein
VNDYVSLGDPVSLQTNNLSVSAWFKTTATGKQTIMRKRLAGYSLFVDTTVSFSVYENDITELICTSPSAYNDGLWHNVVGAYDGTTAILYVDGELVDSVTGSGTGVVYYAPDLIAIGRDGGYSDYYFDGSIKDVQYFNRWIDATEASALSNNEAVTSGLISKWNLNEGTGLVAYDSVGSNDGTIYGATWVIDQATGFDFHALTDDGGGNPRFGAYYNGRPLFVVDPPTGRVFFGEHFWYDPADGAIHTPNDKTVIRADGTIEVVDGRFEGDVWANSGYFRGIFDTTALKLEPGTLNSYVNTASSAITQIKNLVIYALDTLGLSNNTLYRASVPSGTYQTNSGSTLSGDNVKYVAYRRQYIGYGDYSYTVYFYNISKTLILSVQYNDVSGGGKYYFTTSISITTYTGGDSLIVSSDIPTESTGLLNYQIYLSGDTLKVKLP